MKSIVSTVAILAFIASFNASAEMRAVAATQTKSETFQAFSFGNLDEKIIDGQGGGYGQPSGQQLSVGLFSNACAISTFISAEGITDTQIQSTLALLKAGGQLSGERRHRNVLLAERQDGVLHCREENRNRMSLVLSNGVILSSSPVIVVLQTTGQACVDRYNQMRNN